MATKWQPREDWDLKINKMRPMLYDIKAELLPILVDCILLHRAFPNYCGQPTAWQSFKLCLLASGCSFTSIVTLSPRWYRMLV
uniref:Uncharacterized protein LOC105134965 isoform X1 n=1 Tax=Rhizophora mucronata TaxID=61149 RepID=A0A2P2LK19_RHIMU